MKPLNDYIQIEHVTEPVKTSSILLTTAVESAIKVVAVADSVSTVKPGDLITVTNGSEIVTGTYSFVHESNIIAIMGAE